MSRGNCICTVNGEGVYAGLNHDKPRNVIESCGKFEDDAESKC